MNKMKKYKWTLILGSLVTLIPAVIGMLLWDRLPETMPIHWGVDGKADGTAGPWIVVFLIPLILLAMLWLCAGISFRDPRTKNQNPKAMKIALWIIPITSLFSTGIIYGCALEGSFNPYRIVPLFLGSIFMIVGNYLPKTTQNSYLGIKIKWTLYSEENWNATHRFCGRTWFLCGLLVLAGTFLPEKWFILILLLPIVVVVLSSLLYSYLYYRKQIQEGMSPIPKKPLTKKRLLSILAATLGVLVLITIFVYLMFTGDIHIRYDTASFTIEADYMSDFTIEYDAITSIEYLYDPDLGMRISGFNSARLLLGTFRNEEYGTFTLYAYTGSDTAVLLRSGDRILIISGKSHEETTDIYESIKERIK